MTTLPRFAAARLRWNAAAGSESSNVESIATRSLPVSTCSRASSMSCSRFASTTKYVPSPGGSAATETMRPSLLMSSCGAREHLAADGVKDEVDGRDRPFHSPAPTIDRLVGAEIARGVEPVWRRGRDHVGAAPVPKLCGELPSTAGGPVYQDPLARLERLPWSNRPGHALRAGRANRRAVDVVDGGGLRGQDRCRDCGIRSRRAVTIERCEAVDRLSEGDRVDVVGDRDDLAGELV